MRRHHEKPLRRVNPSGKVVWVARYTGADGKRRSAGTFKLQGPCRSPTLPESRYGIECCAQHAIDDAYEREVRRELYFRRPDAVGAYAKTWLKRRPRSERTKESYETRLRAVLDVEVEGRALREWPMAEIRRRHVHEIIDALLVAQGRAQRGAQGILSTLSAMWTDALDEEITDGNPFRGVGIKASDPRIKKSPVPVRVYSWEQMHGFARAAAAARTRRGVVSGRGVGPSGHGVSAMSTVASEIDGWRPIYAEAMVRTLSDCGLRLGELLALRREDVEGDLLHVRRTVWHGKFLDGTKTDHGVAQAGRVVPIPRELQTLLARIPPRIDTGLLFPAVRGGPWQETAFYRMVWRPARAATGMTDARPHEFRHSFVSLMRAAHVIDDADLAAVAGHTVMTMLGHYTHPLLRSYDEMRRVVDGA